MGYVDEVLVGEHKPTKAHVHIGNFQRMKVYQLWSVTKNAFFSASYISTTTAACTNKTQFYVPDAKWSLAVTLQATANSQ